ncbi:magnesium transporter CorA [Acinetobacter radioresistens]|uniref:CorA family divalent cation transporter n=1 Tax=Acinetobacter radioresistens TaxID=40216 RepID=UPI000D0B010D|nr:CorA family divalent cation transporter [Acinetobacter radioresistens]PSD34574.1 magnesium transporter CorA [Acinetobacter radioresistens]
MIISYIKSGNTLTTIQGLPEEIDQNIIWIQVYLPTSEELKILTDTFSIDLAYYNTGEVEIDDYHYIRSELLTLSAECEPIFGKVLFILGENILISINTTEGFIPFKHALRRLNRKSINYASPRAALRVLLQIANDNTDNVIDWIAEGLQQISTDIFQISEGHNDAGKELGVQDLLETITNLNQREGLISRCVESQLSLRRVVRYLNGEVNNTTEADLQFLVTELAGDVTEVKEYATFEYEKVRYLQNAVTNIMNIKQNQIVKIFTIITAVFLPPTLVGTFYGMNFSVMPELSWEYGFLYSMILTLGAAIVPLAYIKHKGWLR